MSKKDPKMAETYGQWLLRQTPERQEAALAHLDNCKLLGEIQRTAPRSAEAARLSDLIRDYHQRWY
jgi:hypothetical protein